MQPGPLAASPARLQVTKKTDALRRGGGAGCLEFSPEPVAGLPGSQWPTSESHSVSLGPTWLSPT